MSSISLLSLDGVLYSFGGKSGLDTSDATALASDILLEKTAYARGSKIVGTIPIIETNQYDIPMYSTDVFTIPRGYYDKDIIITPKYINGTTITDFTESGVFGTIVGISNPNSSGQSLNGAFVTVTSKTDNDNWASRCAGICFNTKIPGTYKSIDITYTSSGSGSGGVSILSSIPSQASNPQVWFSNSGTITQKLSIPSGGGYLYLGTYSTNMGYNNTITRTITVTKCILYTS